MTLTAILILTSALLAFFAGAMVSCLAQANRISEMRDELDRSISLERLNYYLNESLLPATMKNSTSWNAALLDLKKKIEWYRDYDC